MLSTNKQLAISFIALLLLLIVPSAAKAADPADTKMFTALLAPEGAVIYPTKSKDKNAHAYVAEFDPAQAVVGRKKPRHGLQTLVADQYAIISYFLKGRCQFATGGPRADRERRSWSLVDCAGNPISQNDPRIGHFTLATLSYLAGRSNSQVSSAPEWLDQDPETERVYNFAQPYAAHVANSAWAFSEAYLIRDNGAPASRYSFALRLHSSNSYREISYDNNRLVTTIDIPLDELNDEVDVAILNPTNFAPASPSDGDEPISDEIASLPIEPEVKASWAPVAVLLVVAVARTAPYLMAGGGTAAMAARNGGARAAMYASASSGRALANRATQSAVFRQASFHRQAARAYGRTKYNNCLRAQGRCAKAMVRANMRAQKKAVRQQTLARDFFGPIFGKGFEEGFCYFKSRVGMGQAASQAAQIGCAAAKYYREMGRQKKAVRIRIR